MTCQIPYSLYPPSFHSHLSHTSQPPLLQNAHPILTRAMTDKSRPIVHTEPTIIK